MPDLEHARPSTIRDAAWRTAYRLGFPLARLWWRLRRRWHEGALVAVHIGPALLLVRSSYRIAWNFPGGTIRRNETSEMAARRELAEEIGVHVVNSRRHDRKIRSWVGKSLSSLARAGARRRTEEDSRSSDQA